MKPAAELLVRGQVAAPAEVDESLSPAADLVRDDERDDPGVAGEQPVGDALSLAQAVDRLARPAARADHAVGVVEHDDGLAALLEERAPPRRVAVHPHVVLTDA